MATIRSMHRIAPLPIIPSHECDNFHLTDESSAGMCPLCCCFMDRPLEMQCGSLACHEGYNGGVVSDNDINDIGKCMSL